MAETKSVVCVGLVVVGGIFLLAVAMMVSSFHIVDEGHVGIYFKQGALMVIENKTLLCLQLQPGAPNDQLTVSFVFYHVLLLIESHNYFQNLRFLFIRY